MGKINKGNTNAKKNRLWTDNDLNYVKAKKPKTDNINESLIEVPKEASIATKEKILISEVLHSKYITASFKEKISHCFKGDCSENRSESSTVLNDPFNCVFLQNFLNDDQLLLKIERELKELPFKEKSNDLYQFEGTDDLQGLHSPNIVKICNILKGPVRKWLRQVTGICLNKKTSISCSKYDYTDVLLCHDDELQGRRIAFVLYLVPNSWKQKDGGSLDLFSIDKLGRPNVIKKRLFPKFNSFVFFEVSAASYHQVSEILSEDKSRLSINGWFYGEPLDYPERRRLLAPIFRNPCNVEEHLVYSWLNPLFIEPNTQREIRKEFQDKSEIQLDEFIQNKKYKLLCKALKEESMWTFVGPPYKRNYEVARLKKYPSIVREFSELMQSEVMVLILSQLTGLELHRLAPKDSDSEDSDKSDSEEEFSTPKDTSELSNIESGSKKKKKKEKLKKVSKLSEDENLDVIKANDVEDSVGTVGLGGLSSGWSGVVNRKELKDAKELEKNDIESPLAEATCEVRRWDWGSYSLMRDDDLLNNNNSFILDAMLFCDVNKEWSEEVGGGVVYVAKGEEEELLTIVPSSNSLSLVYRDEKTFQFTKFINTKAKNCFGEDSKYYEIYCGYRENKN